MKQEKRSISQISPRLLRQLKSESEISFAVKTAQIKPGQNIFCQNYSTGQEHKMIANDHTRNNWMWQIGTATLWHTWFVKILVITAAVQRWHIFDKHFGRARIISLVQRPIHSALSPSTSFHSTISTEGVSWVLLPPHLLFLIFKNCLV